MPENYRAFSPPKNARTWTQASSLVICHLSNVFTQLQYTEKYFKIHMVDSVNIHINDSIYTTILTPIYKFIQKVFFFLSKLVAVLLFEPTILLIWSISSILLYHCESTFQENCSPRPKKQKPTESTLKITIVVSTVENHHFATRVDKTKQIRRRRRTANVPYEQS